jgi:hypothetical protein
MPAALLWRPAAVPSYGQSAMHPTPYPASVAQSPPPSFLSRFDRVLLRNASGGGSGTPGSGGLACTAFRLVADAPLRTSGGDGHYLSDHFGVEVELRVPSGA